MITHSRLFHSLDPAALNGRSPTVVRWVFGTSVWHKNADHRFHVLGMSVTWRRSWEGSVAHGYIVTCGPVWTVKCIAGVTGAGGKPVGNGEDEGRDWKEEDCIAAWSTAWESQLILGVMLLMSLSAVHCCITLNWCIYGDVICLSVLMFLGDTVRAVLVHPAK